MVEPEKFLRMVKEGFGPVSNPLTSIYDEEKIRLKKSIDKELKLFLFRPFECINLLNNDKLFRVIGYSIEHDKIECIDGSGNTIYLDRHEIHFPKAKDYSDFDKKQNKWSFYKIQKLLKFKHGTNFIKFIIKSMCQIYNIVYKNHITNTMITRNINHELGVKFDDESSTISWVLKDTNSEYIISITKKDVK